MSIIMVAGLAGAVVIAALLMVGWGCVRAASAADAWQEEQRAAYAAKQRLAALQAEFERRRHRRDV